MERIMIKTYKVKLKKKIEIARNTMALYFDRPDGFEYTAGQFATLVHEDQKLDDRRLNRRPMSLGSSPTENELIFAMRVSKSAYKQDIKKAKPGANFSIIGPAGDLVIREDVKEPLILIGGGIGIVPFRSIVKYAMDINLKRNITLFYMNQKASTAAFLPEFRKFERTYTFFKFLPIMTETEVADPDWDGICGRFDARMLNNHVLSIKKSSYMLVGSPGMIDALYKLLIDCNVPKPQILTEKFTGY